MSCRVSRGAFERLTRSHSGIEKELKLVEDKQNRGALQRHAEASEDTEQILKCYRRIQSHLERVMVSINLFLVNPATAEIRAAQCKLKYMEDC